MIITEIMIWNVLQLIETSNTQVMNEQKYLKVYKSQKFILYTHITMKKLLAILALLFGVGPMFSFWYYQSCSQLYWYWSISAGNWYCKCMSWYKWYGNKCVSGQTYCQNLYGFNVSYNSLRDICECNAWYVAYWNKCVSGLTYCQNVYWYNATYDSWRGVCACRSWYGIYWGKCTSYDTICQNMYWWNYHYNSFNGYCETY